MRFADSSPSVQVLSYGILAVVMAAFLMRVVILFRCEYAGLRPVYPSNWSATQCRMLERFRLLICLALIPLWGICIFIVPSMATNWPVGFLSFISMILASHAWVVLLIPRNWKKLGSYPQSFWLTITFLVVWWGVVLTATGWMFVKVTASPPPQILPPIGVFAAPNDVPPFGERGSEPVKAV